jgi:cobalamin biosynthesis protein CobT
MANKIKLPLRRALIDQAKTKRSYVRDGSVLAQNRLVDLQIAPSKVKPFSHEVRGRSTSAAVSLIIDQSGSMSAESSEFANTSAYATSIALSQMRNVKHEVLYMQTSSIFVAKKLSDLKPLVQNFKVEPFGGTPTDVLVARAMMDLALVNRDKKVIIVVTDGRPNDTCALESAIKDCEMLGIKVVGIGIRVGELFGMSGELINDINELPIALKSAIDSVLL